MHRVDGPPHPAVVLGEPAINGRHRVQVINKVLKGETGARLKTYVDTCVHCGLCSEACHYYLSHDNDPAFSPAGKIKQTTVPVDADDVVYEKPINLKMMWRLMGFMRPHREQMLVCVLLVLVVYLVLVGLWLLVMLVGGA